MLLDIHHRTLYRYPSPARRVMQALRLWPAACAHQEVRSWRVEVAGNLVRPRQTDGYGNQTAVHGVDGPLEQLLVEVRGQVETSDNHGVVRGTCEPLPPVFYRGDTELTLADAGIIDLAQAQRQDDALASLHGLMGAVRERIAFSDRHTDMQTTAIEALQLGSGVCQDHAHVMIAAARVLGFPARYVSGYLWIEGEAAEPASHAWCEIAVPDLGWVGFDPANGICPSQLHIRVACGRDAREAAPIRGWREGSGDEMLDVSVTVAQHGAHQQ